MYGDIQSLFFQSHIMLIGKGEEISLIFKVNTSSGESQLSQHLWLEENVRNFVLSAAEREPIIVRNFW